VQDDAVIGEQTAPIAPIPTARGPLDRRIAGLAIPALGSLVAEPLFLLVDTAIVGHLGAVQLAALAVASQVVLTAVSLCAFLAYGTTTRVAAQADRMGRARTLVITILIYALFTALAGFSHTWWQLAIYRFLTALGEVCEKTGWQVHALCLMPNHFHLLLRTGNVPISTVMRRLLTGYAIWFNRSRRRHGHLFQNRFKSILCQEDSYLLELVRYIHLNPLRAGLVKTIQELDAYPYSGHGTLMGGLKKSWQETDEILKFIGSKPALARRTYKQFVEQGIEQGRRNDLAGGGLIRSRITTCCMTTRRRAAIRC